MYEMNSRERKIVELMNDKLDGITVELMMAVCDGHFHFPVRIHSAWMNTDIQDLELSVRSFNCLRRAGITTVGDLVNRIDSREDLQKIRNLGRKSADEIMMALFTGQFMALAPEKRKGYMMEVQKLNC